MKKMIFILSLLLSLEFTSSAQEHSFTNLIGSWRNRQGAGLDVMDSNTIYIVNCDKRKLAGAILSDFSKDLVKLNLSVKDSFRTVVIKSLLLFVNDNTLQWQVVDSEKKPVNFRYERGDILFLKRIQQLNN